MTEQRRIHKHSSMVSVPEDFLKRILEETKTELEAKVTRIAHAYDGEKDDIYELLTIFGKQLEIEIFLDNQKPSITWRNSPAGDNQ